MTTYPNTHTHTLSAANDNPGGATTAELPLAAFVTVIAKAYVAKVRAAERSA